MLYCVPTYWTLHEITNQLNDAAWLFHKSQHVCRACYFLPLLLQNPWRNVRSIHIKTMMKRDHLPSVLGLAFLAFKAIVKHVFWCWAWPKTCITCPAISTLHDWKLELLITAAAKQGVLHVYFVVLYYFSTLTIICCLRAIEQELNGRWTLPKPKQNGFLFS